MSLAPYVQIVARGKGRARPLTMAEARDAMLIILGQQAAPEAIGALLMVLRLRGETPQEIAGFTAALRDHVRNKLPGADLDWPSYAAGRTRRSPLFLLSARLVGQAGFRISMHGWNGHQLAQASVRDAIQLAGPNVCYTPLETLSPEAFALLKLRDEFGLRSCINTVLRMWNPSQAAASVQGVFHPSYRGLQTVAAEMLGQQSLSIIKGGGGEFERHPSKEITVFGLKDGVAFQESTSPITTEQRRLHDAGHPTDLGDLWAGRTQDDFAVATITGTAAIALWTLKVAPTLSKAQAVAAQFWHNRHQHEDMCA